MDAPAAAATPPDALRRVLLLGLAGALSPAWGQTATAKDLPAGAATVTLDFDLDGEAENQLLFSTLRSTARIAAIALVDPQQRTVWRKTASELGLVPREQTPRPELGDALTLPGVRDAARGRWRLVIERAAPFTAAGKLLVNLRLLPRFGLNLVLQTPRPAAGQPALVAVYPSDYGVPMRGLPGIELQRFDAAGQLIGRTTAVEFLRNSQGVAVSNEAGVYIASLGFERAGSYRVEARQVFAGKAATPKTAVLSLTVEPSAAGLQLLGLRLDKKDGNCARGLVFDFAVEVAAAGTYLCDVTLVVAGDRPARQMASTSAELAAGAGRLSVTMPAAAVRALGAGPFRLERVALVRFAPGTPALLLERGDIKLADQAIDPAAFCR